MSKLNINQLIEELQGTFKSLQEACDDQGFSEDDLTEDDHNHIDNEIFLCSSCCWWHESCENSEDGENCVDCYESQNEEE